MLGLITLQKHDQQQDYCLHSAWSSQGPRLTPFKRTTLKDAWRQEKFSKRISQTWKVMYLLLPRDTWSSNSTLECMVGAQQGRRAGEDGWRSWSWLSSITVQGETSNQQCQNYNFRQEYMLFSKDNSIWGTTKVFQSYWNKVWSCHNQGTIKLASFCLGYINLCILHLFSSEIWHLLPDLRSPFYSKNCQWALNSVTSQVWALPASPWSRTTPSRRLQARYICWKLTGFWNCKYKVFKIIFCVLLQLNHFDEKCYICRPLACDLISPVLSCYYKGLNRKDTDMWIVATGHSDEWFSRFAFVLQKFCTAYYFKVCNQPSTQQDIIFKDSKGAKHVNNPGIKRRLIQNTQEINLGGGRYGVCKLFCRRKINTQKGKLK